ncbi:MAG: arginine deiminase-related protein [Anaerolineae bacterium]|nr:arginine deiminase-related protein [Anaerolineae bacterium]
MKFSKAISRTPGTNFADGLTTSELGTPDYALTLKQHQAYLAGLKQCGLEVTLLEADLNHPDSTFVEDVAVLTPNSAILTNPGADSRKGEVAAMQPVLEKFYSKFHRITAPGTLDGGDICEAGSHFFIGISERTNEEGGRQLAAFLAEEGYTSSFVSILGVSGILHLKSGIAYIGENTLVLIRSLADRPEFKGYKIVLVDETEAYAANCVRINDYVIMPTGYPKLQAELTRLGFKPLPLDMSEYQKMDGGLSCLSLRF